ncbi:MAG: DUF4340 domain-containing protein [Anaerolineales bacterium]|nr:DUF4340 domain-containing protein [Anaerolineales bacterium]MCX7609343.1 DUF4340 domain-containing protein [Anaerolineales bacterium]MDW8226534.1 DUF4340 domain-containing protein [Anaerolineales bacterium]
MKTSNWILLILFALAVGTYFLVKHTQANKPSEATPTPSAFYLIQENDTVLKKFRLQGADGRVLELERNQDGFWQILQPERAEAEQWKVSAMESQLGSLMVNTQLGNVANFGDFGLDAPTYLLHLEYYNGVKHKIEVGKLTPTKSGYYVRLDDGGVYVIPQYSLDPILELLDNPPYQPTPTPTP